MGRGDDGWTVVDHDTGIWVLRHEKKPRVEYSREEPYEEKDPVWAEFYDLDLAVKVANLLNVIDGPAWFHRSSDRTHRG